MIELSKRKILFFGELAPRSMNGISIANKINLESLERFFQIDAVVERRRIDFKVMAKLLKVIFVVSEVLNFLWHLMKNKYDIFYTIFPTSRLGAVKCLMLLIVWHLCNPKNNVVVLHVHRGDLSEFCNRSKINLILTKICFNQSTNVLALSDAQCVEYQKLTESCVKVLPNTVRLNSLIRWSMPNSRRLVYFSNYIKDKGLDTLLDSMKQLSEFDGLELHCYGGGTYGCYESRAKSEKIKNVYFHGALNDENKYQVLKDFDLLVFPSYNEGQPLVLLEAMAIGLPVVATNVGLISEMLGVEYPFLVPPKNSMALAVAINNYLMADDKESISNRLRQRFDNQYAFEAHEKFLQQIFCV